MHSFNLNHVKYRQAIAATILTGLFCLSFLTACGTFATSRGTAKPTKNTSGETIAPTTKTSTQPAGDSVGMTSIEAPQLVWPKAKGNFGDAVLFRMAPIVNEESTELMLAGDWQKTGRSANWFIWYADADGEDWLLLGIKGSKLADTDIGTRSFSALTAGADWPREKPAVAIEDAAKAAAAQGANLDALTWVELACAYPAGEFADGPRWVFECSETTDSGFSLNYRIFVNAITGEVTGAINDRNEALALPIDLTSLEKPREENHQADLQAFFDLIIQKDWTFSIFQLSYNLAPDDASRQMWLANFQSLDSLALVSIEPVNLVQWTDEWEIYKVVLKITTGEPVDKYGWENGENTRWMTIIPQGAGNWKIEAISSSP